MVKTDSRAFRLRDKLRKREKRLQEKSKKVLTVTKVETHKTVTLKSNRKRAPVVEIQETLEEKRRRAPKVEKIVTQEPKVEAQKIFQNKRKGAPKVETPYTPKHKKVETQVTPKVTKVQTEETPNLETQVTVQDQRNKATKLAKVVTQGKPKVSQVGTQDTPKVSQVGTQDIPTVTETVSKDTAVVTQDTFKFTEVVTQEDTQVATQEPAKRVFHVVVQSSTGKLTKKIVVLKLNSAADEEKNPIDTTFGARMDPEEFIKSAVESEISRMLAKNAAHMMTGAAYGLENELEPTVQVKQEPVEYEPTNQEEEEEEEEMVEGDPSKYITEDPPNAAEGYSLVQSMAATGSTGKYSVKVVTKYMCRYCARQFDSPDKMQEHIASHTKNKNTTNHNCFVCGKTYSTPSKLQRHVRVHSGERPYACNICGRRFTRSDHVKQHLKVHMPQKQKNTCRLCNQKFLRRQTLHAHLQNTHGVNTVYTCHRCGEAFDEITKLHSHKTSHVSIYGKNDGPAVEGGMVIKQEPGEEGKDVPMIGLAKFSLGPQPAPEELIKIMNANKPKPNSDKKTGCVADTTHRLAVTVSKNLGGNATTSVTASHSYPLKYISQNDEQEYEESGQDEEMEDDDHREEISGTVSDGMNMFILPSDIKKEPEDTGYPMDESQNSYVDDIPNEENGNGQLAENLLTKHPEEHKGIKMKLFGPASYKAMKVAMQNKIAMNTKTPLLRFKHNNIPVSVVRNTNNTGDNATIKSNRSSSFSPYVVKGSGSHATSSSPVQETITPEKEKRLSKCEHCCIWFEDYTMCLLHNSLHSAEGGDPFTCRKCMKKLGNRLEFTAHLVWHLEPDMEK